MKLATLAFLAAALCVSSRAYADTFVGPEIRRIAPDTYLINGVTIQNATGRVCSISLGPDGQLRIDQCHINAYKVK